MRFKAFFAWYDLWVGAYYDRERHSLYVCPLPMCVLQFTPIRYFKAYHNGGKAFLGYCTDAQIDRLRNEYPTVFFIGISKAEYMQATVRQ